MAFAIFYRLLEKQAVFRFIARVAGLQKEMGGLECRCNYLGVGMRGGESLGRKDKFQFIGTEHGRGGNLSEEIMLRRKGNPVKR